MSGLPDLPLHPAAVHFPIAGSLFALAALLGALVRPARRSAWLDGAALLLAATVASAAAAGVTGWLWADTLAYLPGGSLVPAAEAVAGLARRHALLAAGGLAVSALALVLTLRARKRDGAPVPALAAAAVAAALIGFAGHIGGTMVHRPPDPVPLSGAPTPDPGAAAPTR